MMQNKQTFLHVCQKDGQDNKRGTNRFFQKQSLKTFPVINLLLTLLQITSPKNYA